MLERTFKNRGHLDGVSESCFFRVKNHTVVELGYIDYSWANEKSGIMFVRVSGASQFYSYNALEIYIYLYIYI